MANDPPSVVDDQDAELYHALMEKDQQKVIGLCRKYEEGPFHSLTRREDTVLHFALFSKQVDLVLHLLSDFTPTQCKMLSRKNSTGNTILHEAATLDDCVRAAKRILELEPQLMKIPNKKGEFPIFRAVRYGQIKMFKFLIRQVHNFFPDQDHHEQFHTNVEGTTILHIAIYHEHFELACYIAKKYKYLVGKKNKYGMTGLQILATIPSAFTNRNRGWLKYLILAHPLVAIEDEDVSLDEQEGKTILIANEDEDGCLDERKVAPSCRVPWWDRIHKECRRYEAAVELANFLVQEDTTWIHEHDNGKPNSSSAASEKKAQVEFKETQPPSPLVLATMWGCLEIARQILTLHPQTVEQVGPYGSILHLAIKYRRIEIFDMVEKMDMPMRRLIRKNDINGNSILHMVGDNMTRDEDQSTKKNRSDSIEEETENETTSNPWDLKETDKETRSPAFELQDDLLLFERVEEILKVNYHKNINSKKQTPDELFALNKEMLRDQAQEWLKRTAENCSIVAVLIATVAFAAAYTVPGGSKDNGVPILINQPFFVIFTITDVLSLTFTLTAVIIFLSILTSSFQLKDFKQSLPQKLMLGISCLIFSVSMMMLAFGATIILMISNKERWTKIALYTVALLPVTVLTVTYLPLYVPLMRTFNYTLAKIRAIFPECTIQSPNKKRSNFNKIPSTSNPLMIRREQYPVPPYP